MQLVIDGSGNFLDISLFKNRDLVYTLFSVSVKTHSQVLINIIDSILSQLEISLDNINELYCVAGPGKYTSIRVVISTLKGLFFDKNITVYRINGLDLAAASCFKFSKFRVISDFFSKKAYFCDYEKNKMPSRQSRIGIGSKEEVNSTNLPTIHTTDKDLFPKTKFIFGIEQYFEKVKLFDLNPIY